MLRQFGEGQWAERLGLQLTNAYLLAIAYRERLATGEMSIPEFGQRLRVGKTRAYQIVRALEGWGLVERQRRAARSYQRNLGGGVVVLMPPAGTPETEQ